MNEEVLHIILSSWTKETCFPSSQEEWDFNNPSLGQCAVTSLVINDLYGAKIMRCIVNGISHYYNLVDGKVVDITATQFGKVIPKYETGKETTREYLLSNDDTKERYYKLLKNISCNLTTNIFESINNDGRIDNKYLKSIFSMCTFEIDSYYDCEEYETVVFDLAAQNTGNIFKYKYYKHAKKYELIGEPVLCAIRTHNYNIPNYILNQIFEVARENSKKMELQTKLQKKLALK